MGAPPGSVMVMSADKVTTRRSSVQGSPLHLARYPTQAQGCAVAGPVAGKCVPAPYCPQSAATETEVAGGLIAGRGHHPAPP